MKIVLAPMDGLTDFYVRRLLTQMGGFDLCITEFLRVTSAVYPNRIFYKNCPEIDPKYELGGKTASGVPVHMQLLGSDENYLAENAFKACKLGAKGIDLNFGCPSKTVNHHGGGAVLLERPEKIYTIVQQVRQALPKQIPLSAKMRLGYHDSSLALENALAIQAAGAEFLTIHARTKQDGYRPPAKWQEVGDLVPNLSIPVIVNGEVWSVDDYIQCRKHSQCDDVMIGRGAFALPDLAYQIKQYQIEQPVIEKAWNDIQGMLRTFYHLMIDDGMIADKHISGRLKLWLKWLTASYDEAQELLERVKTLKDHPQIISYLEK